MQEEMVYALSVCQQDLALNQKDRYGRSNVLVCQTMDMDANVLDHEPSTALFVPDADPLLFYRAITRYALAALNEDGHLLFECNMRSAEATAAMTKSEGMGSADVADDCFGLPRFVDAVR